jgi:beta-ketodecanoyl-[acyl-carrier-protein] synthase
MIDVVISGSGVYHPEESISNQELVAAFNSYVDIFNKNNKAEILSGSLSALEYSDHAFIEKASGIKSRYVIDKGGILNPRIMHPVIEESSDDVISLQAKMAVKAAEKAFISSKVTNKDIDVVIVACSNMQRSYPAMAIEVQQALDINGFAYDMNVACSSATFALQMAQSLIQSKTAKTVLIVNPEICSAHLNFCDRDSHFIFGDVATAMVVQDKDIAQSETLFKIISSKLATKFSNNIRNNGGFMNRLSEGAENLSDKLFYQNGRKVFKEVTIEVLKLVRSQLESLELEPNDLSCLWLHQANLNMNRLISSKLMERDLTFNEAPIILDTYANTASAGSIVAFHNHHKHVEKSQYGLLCSFGAGYSIGSIILQRL